jgi:hypothetical protein
MGRASLCIRSVVEYDASEATIQCRKARTRSVNILLVEENVGRYGLTLRRKWSGLTGP